ncbi:hypothetical protein C8Q79DRAFT_1012324 [Trametes meyenii]|nr:hypothetical protein C8Q79DRAFT_1012324 [Trametes meyenii]
MAYCLASAGRLARELWPTTFNSCRPKLPPVDKLAEWQVVPAEYDDICAWATVDRYENGLTSIRHGYVLLYSPDISPVQNQPTPVLIQFHGVVEAMNISPIGNYNGRKEAAPRAIQYLTLGASSYYDAFSAQLKAIEHLQSFIASSLSCGVQTNVRNPGTIYFQRVVFAKARNAASTSPRSVLVFGDDPHGWALAVQRDWVVTHRIVTGIYNNEGVAVKKPYTVIRPGDFVEVAARLEIAKFRKTNRWVTEARFIIQEVLRLCDRTTIQSLFATCSFLFDDLFDEPMPA